MNKAKKEVEAKNTSLSNKTPLPLFIHEHNQKKKKLGIETEIGHWER
mgnify:FL=1